MPETRLQAFMLAVHITPVQLATESGVSRQALLRVRTGEEEPRVSTVAAIVRACRRVSGRAVRAADLFDLGERSTHHHPLRGVTEARQSLPSTVPEGMTRLRAFLVTHGLSRAQVAAASGLSKERLSAYVKGSDAKLTNVRKLCAGLTRLLGRPVRGNDVFDFGEDERDPRLRQLKRKGRRANT